MQKVKIGVINDHKLVAEGFKLLIESFGFTVTFVAYDGEAALKFLDQVESRPDIILMDVKMPVMNGENVARSIAARFPGIKIVALSDVDDNISVVKMIKAGACSYILKDIEPKELEIAILEVYQKGYYASDLAGINFRRLLTKGSDLPPEPAFTERELLFIKLAASDQTYREIAAKMHISERTVDGYRESVFQKLNVQSRVGLVLEAVRRNLIDLAS